MPGLFALCQHRLGHSNYRGCRAQKPISRRIPDCPKCVLDQPTFFITSINNETHRKLQQTRGRENHAGPAGQHCWHTQRLRPVLFRQSIGCCPTDDREHQCITPQYADPVFETHDPHATIFPTKNVTTELDRCFVATLRPAQTLPPQRAKFFRNENPGECARLEADVPAAQLQLPTDVDVFGHGLTRPVTHVVESRRAETRIHAGYGKYSSDAALGAFDHADDGGEFTNLNSPEQ